jgi:hypothetical protein
MSAKRQRPKIVLSTAQYAAALKLLGHSRAKAESLEFMRLHCIESGPIEPISRLIGRQ